MDHDQAYQQNVNLHYRKSKDGWWGTFTWRYDSGLVVGRVRGLEDALGLTAAQQSVIGLYCGSERASLSHRITSCASSDYGAQRIRILSPGEVNDDHNPPRTTPRPLFHLGVGTENLFHAERLRTVVRLTVMHLSNAAALYSRPSAALTGWNLGTTGRSLDGVFKSGIDSSRSSQDRPIATP